MHSQADPSASVTPRDRSSAVSGSGLKQDHAGTTNNTPVGRSTGGMGRSGVPLGATLAAASANAAQRQYNRANALAAPQQAQQQQTLGSFIAGAENNLAYSALCSAVRTPGARYNPLFIHGPHGTGKTHLLRAAAHGLVRGGAAPDRVIYMTAETFARRFTLNMRSGRSAAFRERHQQAVALLIDDVNEVSGQVATIQELCHTLDIMRDAGAQIIIADTLPPAQLRLPDRLRSRLAAGLIVGLQPPSVDTLVSITRYRCRLARLPISEETVIGIGRGVYERASTQPGGALPALEAVLRLAVDNPHVPVTELLTRALALPRDLLQEQSGVAIDRVLQAVCQYFGITKQTLLSKRRDPWTVQARQLAMYLLHEDGGLGVTRVGRVLGRDHSTVLHGHAQIVRAIEAGDKEIQDGLVDIRRSVFVSSPAT